MGEEVSCGDLVYPRPGSVSRKSPLRRSGGVNTAVIAPYEFIHALNIVQKIMDKRTKDDSKCPRKRDDADDWWSGLVVGMMTLEPALLSLEAHCLRHALALSLECLLGAR